MEMSLAAGLRTVAFAIVVASSVMDRAAAEALDRAVDERAIR